MTETVPVSDVVIQNRIRKDLGDIPALAKSIQENGLIEPLVLSHDWRQAGLVGEPPDKYIKLIAGERRLTALKSLGLTELIHAQHYIWRSELESDDPKKKLLAASIEIEENIRRKDLTWVEQIEGKARLLKIMQEIHGVPSGGRPSDNQVATGTQGFGVRTLAAMLGESPTQTSQDLELATFVAQAPALKNAVSKDDAIRRIQLATQIALGLKKPNANVAQALKYQILITCKDEEEQRSLLIQFKNAGMNAVPVIS